MSRPPPEDDQSDDEENDDEANNDIVFGIRRSRRATNFAHRDSSASNPAQMMDRDVHYDFAEDMALLATHLSHVLALLFAMHQRYSSIIQNWQRIQGVAITIIDSIKKKMSKYRKAIDHVSLLIRWILCYGEVALLHAEDLSVFSRLRRPQMQPKRYRRIAQINRQDCDSWFGTNPHDLRRLFTSWRIPNEFSTSHREVFNGEECFIIFLYRLRKGTPCTKMV